MELNTPLDQYINKLETTILNFCKIDETDYFDIRSLDKFQKKNNVLDLVKLFYKLNGIVKIQVKQIKKIKPSDEFYYRNNYPFIKRNTIKEKLDSIFNFKLRYKDIYLIYKGFYTFIEEMSDYYRVKIFIREKMQIKFYFNETGLYISCPLIKKCKHSKIKTISGSKCCHKRTRSSLNKCNDIKLEYVDESAYPSKICVSELYTIYNLYKILEEKVVTIKNTPDRKNEVKNNLNTKGFYISRTRIKYLNPIKREKKERKKPRTHTRIGHWRTYKKLNKRIWISQIIINKKSDIKKINKTPYLL